LNNLKLLAIYKIQAEINIPKKLSKLTTTFKISLDFYDFKVIFKGYSIKIMC